MQTEAKPDGRGERVAVVGLGHAGLPVALAFARRFPTVGYDIDAQRIARLHVGCDDHGEVSAATLRQSRLGLSHDPHALREASSFVVVVPTGLDAARQPELTALMQATETVGALLQPGAVVVYESTVPPGTTMDRCRPLLERISGLRCGRDFGLAYSPERINPGDPEHRFERITKVVAATDEATVERVATLYAAVLEAGVHRAPSIGVAEMAKLIENTQRDLDIALVNELGLVCERLGIDSRAVLETAATKWNFRRLTPGLVGGPCLGLAPRFVASSAEQHGYEPRVMLAGRRVNERLARQLARRAIELLRLGPVAPEQARVGICGLSFKPNVGEIRHSGVLDLIDELRRARIEPRVHDPHAEPGMARKHGVALSAFDDLGPLDALVLAVAHDRYRQMPSGELLAPLRHGGLVLDVQAMIDRSALPAHLRYWSL